MSIRVAAIEVSHWHALNDAAYLRHLIAMSDVELVAIQDSDARLVARRAAEVGSPPTFTNYRQMLSTTRPDFVVALGRHRQMAGIAHTLLDEGYPFLMEKPMGINAPEVEAVAEKATRLNAFIAVPLAQRYAPFATRARELLAAGRFGTHIYIRINRPGPARYPAWDCAWTLDPCEAGGGFGATNQRARLRAGRAVDRPGVRARGLTINEARGRMPAAALTSGRVRWAAMDLFGPRRAHPRTVVALPCRPG